MKKLAVLSPLLVIVAIQLMTTRGQLTDHDRRPIAGADVVIGDSSGIRMSTRTNSSGYFRFIHAPWATRGQALLICAPSFKADYEPQVNSALIHQGYLILPYRPGYQRTAREEGWLGPTPSSCPPTRSAPAG